MLRRRGGSRARAFAALTAMAPTAMACSTLLGVDELPAMAKKDGGEPDVPSAPPGTRFCEQQKTPVTFCRDFDDGKSYEEDFFVQAPPGNLLTGDPETYVSPPLSLLSDVTSTDDVDDGRRAAMSRQFHNFSPTDVRLSFDLLVERAPVSPVNAIVANIDFAERDKDKHHGLAINVTSTSAFLEELAREGQYEHYDFAHSPEVGKWARFDVHIVTFPPHVTASLDGVEVVNSPLAGTWPATTLDLYVGTFWVTEEHVKVRVRHDNVVLDLH